MKRLHIFILLLTAAIMTTGDAPACTSAIISSKASRNGRPLLWKHRDTSNVDNVVDFISGTATEFSFTALYNATDKARKEAWVGMNEKGFAVMNTASYNIKNDKVPNSQMDKEGIIMTGALKKCVTVDDFRLYLDSLISLGRPLGVEANFGVIDAEGNGAYFETNNNSYKVYDLADAEDGILIRTNYSHSGGNPKTGKVREDNAEHLLRKAARGGDITAEMLTEDVSRCFYRATEDRNFAHGTERLIADVDFIPRYKSTASVVIEGMVPGTEGDPVDEYIMWTALGYPPTAITAPVYCREDGMPASFRGTLPNGHAPAADAAKKLRDEVFAKSTAKKKIVNLELLFNAKNDGYCQRQVMQNLNTYRMTRQRLNRE